MGFIGSDSRVFRPLPRADIVPGLARSRASFWGQRGASGGSGLVSSRITTGNNDLESRPLICDGDSDNGEEPTSDRRTRRSPYPSDRLAPDTPWDDDDGSSGEDNFVDASEDVEFRGQRGGHRQMPRRHGDGHHGSGRRSEEDDEDEGGFVFVRPEFISVPQESPKL